MGCAEDRENAMAEKAFVSTGSAAGRTMPITMIGSKSCASVAGDNASMFSAAWATT